MCGFVGVISKDTSSVNKTKKLIAKLQHRGQSASGIASFNIDGTLSVLKKRGKVANIMEYNRQSFLSIAHVRYPTIGTSEEKNAQPFISRNPGMILAHNGHIINYGYLNNLLATWGVSLSSSSDIEPVLFVLSRYITEQNTLDKTVFIDAVKYMFSQVRGAFSFVGGISLENKQYIFAIRDPYGFRPLFWAKYRTGELVIASENNVFIGEDTVETGELERGHLLLSDGDNLELYKIEQREKATCVFEEIYFSHPNTRYGTDYVYDYRKKLGFLLAEKLKASSLKFDVVGAIPSTAYPMALAVSESLDIPYQELFIQNKSYRTFILDNKDKQRAVQEKLTPIYSMFNKKSILLVDDSLVRGSTIKAILQKIRDFDIDIHLAIASPPVIAPCYYGIDIVSSSELFAKRFIKDDEYILSNLEQKMAENLGIKSITYLTVEDLERIFGKNKCMACFNNKYPLSFQRELIGSVDFLGGTVYEGNR